MQRFYNPSGPRLSRGSRSDHTRRNADGDRTGGDMFAHDGGGADHRMTADLDAVENFRAGANPHSVANAHASRNSRLRQDRLDRIREIVIAANDVGVRRHQHHPADGDTAGREDFAVEADVGAVGQLDIAVLARKDRVAPDKDPVADADAAVGFTLGIEETVVVDGDVAADVNLVRMAEDDVLAEYDVAAARSEEERVQDVSQRETERPAARLCREHDELVLDQRADAAASHHELFLLLPAGLARREQLLLRPRDDRRRSQRAVTRGRVVRHVHIQPCRRYQDTVRVIPSRRPMRSAYPSSWRALEISKARLLVKKSSRRPWR